VLHDYGITLQEPQGWNTRFYRVIAPLRGPAVLQACTASFAASDYSTYQPATCAGLSPSDALLIAMIFDPAYTPTNWSKPTLSSVAGFAFGLSDFGLFQGLPQNQIQARSVFIFGGRMCEIVGCFGSNNPDGRLLGSIMQSIHTLQIGPSAAKESDGQAVEVSLV
jgi:hypothetical protein